VELHQVEHFLKGLALFQGCIAAAADGDSPVFGQITALKLLQEGHADLVAHCQLRFIRLDSEAVDR
jgi:hypothetical protein